MKNQKKLSKAEMKNVLGGMNLPIPCLNEGTVKCYCGTTFIGCQAIDTCLTICG